MEYKRYFVDSWKELCKKAKNQTFTPHQEQDLICMMYHLCLKKMGDSKRIHAASTWNYDLILGRLIEAKKKDQTLSHCLLAEFKLITRHRKKNRLKSAKKDILRLSQTKKSNPTIRRVCAIFDIKGDVTFNEIEELKKLTDNVDVLFGNLK